MYGCWRRCHSFLPSLACSGSTFSSSTRGAHCHPMRSHTSGEHLISVNPEQIKAKIWRSQYSQHALPVPTGLVSRLCHAFIPYVRCPRSPQREALALPSPLSAMLSSPTMRPTTAASTSLPAWPGSLAPQLPLPLRSRLGPLPHLPPGPPLQPGAPRATSSGVTRSPYCSHSPLSLTRQLIAIARICSSPTARTTTSS